MAKRSAIELDWASGAIRGAGLRERLGLAAFRAALLATANYRLPGFSKLVAVLRHVFASDRDIQVHFPDGSVFAFPWGDLYWSVLCTPGFTYEPEIEGLLARCRMEGIAFDFLDCGANFGFWSVRATSPRGMARTAIAVEASAESVARLDRNRALNGERFEIAHNAIAARSGEIVHFDNTAKHEQRSVAVAGAGFDTDRVTTVSIDDLAGKLPEGGCRILKLDVEGLEIEALGAAAHLLDEDTLVIFEDHGSDRAHGTARAILEELGLRLFASTGEGRFNEIEELSALDRLKPNRRRGYDFFATRSPFWLEFCLRKPASADAECRASNLSASAASAGNLKGVC